MKESLSPDERTAMTINVCEWPTSCCQTNFGYMQGYNTASGPCRRQSRTCRVGKWHRHHEAIPKVLTSEKGFCKANSWRCRTRPGCSFVKYGRSEGCIKLSCAPCRTSRPCRACSVAGRFSANRPTTCSCQFGSRLLHAICYAQ